ncbi:MAG: VOC family protein [Acidimicrobiales bacterium]
MAIVDHLVYRVPDLNRGGAFISALTGVSPTRGGPHPGAGTHNSLLSLGPETYLEIIATDPDQADHTGPRPFGVDPDASQQLVTFAVHPGPGESLAGVAAVMAELGFDPGPSRSMSRVTPAGQTLTWTLTSAPQGPVPFVIDWGATTNPAGTSPGGCSLVELHCCWPEPGRLQELHQALSINSQILRGEPAVFAVIDTPHGRVDIR